MILMICFRETWEEVSGSKLNQNQKFKLDDITTQKTLNLDRPHNLRWSGTLGLVITHDEYILEKKNSRKQNYAGWIIQV